MESYIKRTENMLFIPLRGQKVVLSPLRVLHVSLKRSTAGAFAVPYRVLNQKNMIGDNVLHTCKSWFLLGKKKTFKPRPQNRISVPLRSSFQTF